jgi:rubrerythrin
VLFLLMLAAREQPGMDCTHCGYSQAGLTTPTCPECGARHT